MGEEQAKKALDRLLKTESDFMPVFTGKFSLNYFLEILEISFANLLVQYIRRIRS